MVINSFALSGFKFTYNKIFNEKGERILVQLLENKIRKFKQRSFQDIDIL